MRIITAWRLAVEEGRLLIVSPFSAPQSRPTADLAIQRNRFVAALATEMFVSYAEPGSKTDDFCQWCLAQQIPLSTLTPARRPAQQIDGVAAVTTSELIRKLATANRREHRPNDT